MNNRLSRRSFLRDTLLGVSSAGIGMTGMKKNAAAATRVTPYFPTWESLDTNPCPGWFNDAKLGMYFHWGVCSVPAWAPRKEGISYAEWSWYNMNNRDNPTWQYHRDTYGENFTYDDFIPLFKAERYDPEEWVSFAKQTGMKYIFVNAKHHDGYCLWPSRYTNRNAYKMGPERDLIGPLIAAARRENLRVGFYKWQGESFRIPSVQPVAGSPITMLGVESPLMWCREGDGIIIDYPLHRSRPARCAYAWAFKIRVKE